MNAPVNMNLATILSGLLQSALLLTTLSGCQSSGDEVRLPDFFDELPEADVADEEEGQDDATVPDDPGELPTDRLRHGHVAIVNHIVDGDTFDVRIGDRAFIIRVLGINSPECLKDGSRVAGDYRYRCVADDEFYGLEAYREAVRLLAGARITISCHETDYGEPCETDFYDRYLAYAELPDGRDFGAEMTARGAAFSFTRYPAEKRATYCLNEYDAQQEGAGMWAEGTVEEVLGLMSESTRGWYAEHDARCDAAIEAL